MLVIILIGAGVFWYWTVGFNINFKDNKTVSPLNSVGIKISTQSDDNAPEFKRKYVVQLPNDRTMEIDISKNTLWKGWSEIEEDGILTQADGNYIMFDPDNVADKIIDPQLVAIIKPKIKIIEQIDKTWRMSHPNEFVDENGVTWVRKQK